jgi:hypothetical protein
MVAIPLSPPVAILLGIVKATKPNEHNNAPKII